MRTQPYTSGTPLQLVVALFRIIATGVLPNLGPIVLLLWPRILAGLGLVVILRHPPNVLTVKHQLVYTLQLGPLLEILQVHALATPGPDVLAQPLFGALPEVPLATLVLLREQDQRREARDPVLTGYGLVDRRVQFGDHHLCVVLEGLRQGLVHGDHGFAVPAPRRVELHQHGLGRVHDDLIKIALAQRHHRRALLLLRLHVL
mmetsp:Transcript_28110/g.47765  ORF Transcript_28110/g.47765 Transcript_28110/m.47765 type:complete len:203 (-) Transcript_28110:1524-2132(-)